MPKVSICIPTYNNVAALKRCLESVLMQDFCDYEIIITDDSSNNNVENYVKTLHIHNLKYFKNKKNFGSPENWNEAIQKAEGELIKILHHDDEFSYPNSLRIFVDLLECSDCDFAFTGSRVVFEDSKKVLKINAPDSEFVSAVSKDPTLLLAGNFIGAPSAVIFKRDNSISFDTATIWLVDIDFYISYIKKHGKIAYNETDAITTYVSKNQITSKVENDKKINIFEYFYVADKQNVKEITTGAIGNQYKKIVQKFGIKSLDDIGEAGYNGKLPDDIKELFIEKNNKSVSLITKFKKILKKFIN